MNQYLHRLQIGFHASLIWSLFFTSFAGGQNRDVKAQKLLEYKTAQEAHALLESWISDGTASGLAGTLWDNRDDGHSKVNLKQMPGMTQFQYKPSEARTRGWGLQFQVRGSTTVGNSSTAHKQIEKGSQPRCAYSAANGLAALQRQFKANNIYIYPCHMDHIAGNQRLGRGQKKKWGAGRGDMYPTNTPYLVISQGSSGTDQPFIRAIAWTIGSFSKPVRSMLEKNGMLMATVQMIMRRCQIDIDSREDYLTGKAHPAVFDRQRLNAIKMMRMAHDMQIDSIPPLVQLDVVAEDEMIAGTDFIGAQRQNEKIYDSAEVISRVWRGFSITRQMKVSAEGTMNPSGRPLRYRWVVLRGPAGHVEFTPLNKEGSMMDINITYPGRTESEWNQGMWSNRLDIGVFAETDRSISAPSFITWFTLDNEERTYSGNGTIQSIDYGTGRFVDPRISISLPFRDDFQYHDGKLAGIFRHWENGQEQRVALGGKSMKILPRLLLRQLQQSPGSIKRNDVKPPLTQDIKHTRQHALQNQRHPPPNAEEIRTARKALEPDLLRNLDHLIDLSRQTEDAKLFVLLNEIIVRAAAAEQLVVAVRAFDQLTGHFDGNLAIHLSGAIKKLNESPQLSERNTELLCELALGIEHSARLYKDMDTASQMASVAVRHARSLDDISLQRRVVRQISDNSTSQ